MHRWSKLQKALYRIVDPRINFQLHCSVYPMQSQMGSTDLPRYWITLNQEIIFDYPKQFVNRDGLIDNLSAQGKNMVYPYNCKDICGISNLIRAYIDTPVDEIMTKHYEQDFWGLANILRAADRRIGLRRLETLRRRKGNIAAQKVIFARQSLQNAQTASGKKGDKMDDRIRKAAGRIHAKIKGAS